MTQYWPFSNLMRHGSLRERLIVSLDLGDRHEAMRLVDQLAGSVGMFGVGKHLFLHAGPDFVREIRKRGVEVFLDLKFHDTPQAVCKGAIEATRLGAKMFDLHPWGIFEVMERTRLEVTRVCRLEGLRRPLILAVAMLTSMDRPRTDNLPRPSLMRLAKAAADAALDGVVTSPLETARVRASCGRRFVIVTSGVHLDDECEGRGGAMSPGEAVRAGADYLVVGSPIWSASEPIRAVRQVLHDMERGLRSAPRPDSPAPRPG